MESLAYLVLGILATELLVSLGTVTFSVIYRLRGKFRRTSMTLTAILAIVAGWLMGQQWQIGLPATIAVVISVLLLFLPKKN